MREISKSKSAARLLAFGVIGAIGALCLYFSLTPYRNCDIQYLTRDASPSHLMEVSTYLVDCAVGFGQDSSFFSIVLRNLKNKTNFDQEDQIASVEGDSEAIKIATTWIDDNNLKIDIPKNAKLASHLTKYRGVDIIYEPPK